MTINKETKMICYDANKIIVNYICSKITKKDLEAYIILVDHVKKQNKSSVLVNVTNYDEIAKGYAFSQSYPNFCRSLRKLKDAGWIEKGEEITLLIGKTETL